VSYEPPAMRPLGNIGDPSSEAARHFRRQWTHNCGACRAQLFTARWNGSGLLVHVEVGGRVDGDVVVVPQLPGFGDKLPRVERSTTRRTQFREHVCPEATRSFSGAARRRKQR
jgi:hypothetical protein